ncbi:MAG: hypothetical protein HY704_04365 [Gemmatimonadetes bacterium]|nr:hypothetical protein [Gemmatimonadota bacterium]
MTGATFDAALESAEGWEPRLAVPESLTPLPAVDRALPVLGLFASLLGRRHARYKVALLGQIAREPRARWKIREIQEAVAWLEPGSVTRLVSDLRAAGLLLYDPALDAYRLSHEARVVAAVCSALAVPEISYGRIIRILASAMALAQATGAPEEAAYAPFLSAIAVLEADRQELRRLIDDRSEQALLEAAELARLHVADMQELLEEQAETFARFHADPRYLEHDQRAHTLIARVGRLATEVVAALSERAEELMRGGLRFDRQDLRELVAGTDPVGLAAIVSGASAPPSVAPIDPVAAFAALDGYLGRADRVPGDLPDPEALSVEPPPDTGPDDFEVAAEALADLAARGGGPLTGWVVGGDWPAAVARHSAVVEAWARHGPPGDGRLAADLDARPDLETVNREGVAHLSRTLVVPRGGETVASGAAARRRIGKPVTTGTAVEHGSA